ncbi:low molecular weight protein-tyrosine-phosphatase [Spiribacter pallidus]|uniref:protein-tyrosine-phosphatase n=1 Tax=Spiribacter pallidus TaxID=1987936 RepID=A0ABV3TCD3_9GAMM
MTDQVKVLFVCMGNICRSPTAEGVFRHKLMQAGLDGYIHTDSAGTHDYHIGRPPDARSVEEARSRGINISDLRARQVDRFDFEFFDHILAMDAANLEYLTAMAPAAHRERLDPLLGYAPQLGTQWVPDPYFGGRHGFRQVYDLIDPAAEGLLESIRSRYSLPVPAS